MTGDVKLTAPRADMITINGRHVHYDSARYWAVVRVRYRKHLIRRGVPGPIVIGLRTLPELRALALSIAGRHELGKTEVGE